MAKAIRSISIVKGNKTVNSQKENWKFYIYQSSPLFEFVSGYMNKLNKYPYNSIFRDGKVVVDFDVSQGQSNHINTIYDNGSTKVLPISFAAPKSWHKTFTEHNYISDEDVKIDGNKLIFDIAKISNQKNNSKVNNDDSVNAANRISSQVIEQLINSDKFINNLANNVSLKLATVLSTRFNRFAEETKSIIKSESQLTSDETAKRIFKLMKQAGWFE